LTKNKQTPYHPEIHHRRSIRLQEYDYSQAGLYFVTICVQNRECLFGNIADGEMRLNEIGEIARNCWMEIPQHYPDTQLYDFVVMPNHIHGIIDITPNDATNTSSATPTITRVLPITSFPIPPIISPA
jgi:REP element-mobilizing transposase RayT